MSTDTATPTLTAVSTAMRPAIITADALASIPTAAPRLVMSPAVIAAIPPMPDAAPRAWTMAGYVD